MSFYLGDGLVSCGIVISEQSLFLLQSDQVLLCSTFTFLQKGSLCLCIQHGLAVKPRCIYMYIFDLNVPVHSH